MRERVTALGGRLRAAPRSEGGFTVQAELPRGLSNDQVAERMVISPLTAKTHVNRAMAERRARDRAQLVVLAYEFGLVAPRDSCRPRSG
jgi:DNA-binding CsgD family transcriptional regulator